MKLASVALVVPDYDAAIRFFAAIGFTVTNDINQGDKRWVTLAPPDAGLNDPAGGGAELVLARAEGPRQIAAIGDQAGGRVWLFLETDDFSRDHAALIAAGARFEEPPRHEPYGTVAVWRDPWGNRWDLIERR